MLALIVNMDRRKRKDDEGPSNVAIKVYG